MLTHIKVHGQRSEEAQSKGEGDHSPRFFHGQAIYLGKVWCYTY